VLLRDGGVIAPGYDAELDELRNLSEHGDQYLLDMESRERERTGIANLKISYNRVHGYYIEVSRGQAGKVPVGLPAPPDPQGRRALHHPRAQGTRGQGAERPRPQPGAGKAAL
jgi:hypothetical protein